MRPSDRLPFVTPLPPLSSGIAQYSRDLLQATGGTWPLDVIAERGSALDSVGGYVPRRVSARSYRDASGILQLGNSGFHQSGFDAASRTSSLLVLHDVVLHHGRLAMFVATRRSTDYRRLMAELYGEPGRRLASEVIHGRMLDDLSQYPLFEDLVRRARLTVVHSEYARDLVTQRMPDADVIRIPMGVPLPQQTAQDEAREQLGLPASAFVIASITHVNPYKRIPVVLRALRRLIDRVPEAVFVIAGSVAPSVSLRREIEQLSLNRHVVVTGYISDAKARLIARAADVCVNLRYPSTGETSASLLRLLGAARPVIVTDDIPLAEYPRSAVLPVPVDRFEDEFLAELLLMLAQDSAVRLEAGQAARRFIEREHSMTQALAGYSEAIHAAFGIRLPRAENVILHDPDLRLDSSEIEKATRLSTIDEVVADAVVHLRLVDHDATMTSIVKVMRDLRLT